MKSHDGLRHPNLFYFNVFFNLNVWDFASVNLVIYPNVACEGGR